jgi:hypothetical protein
VAWLGAQEMGGLRGQTDGRSSGNAREGLEDTDWAVEGHGRDWRYECLRRQFSECGSENTRT